MFGKALVVVITLRVCSIDNGGHLGNINEGKILELSCPPQEVIADIPIGRRRVASCPNCPGR